MRPVEFSNVSRVGEQNHTAIGWETSVLLSINHFYDQSPIQSRKFKDPTPSTLQRPHLRSPSRRTMPYTAILPTSTRLFLGFTSPFCLVYHLCRSNGHGPLQHRSVSQIWIRPQLRRKAWYMRASYYPHRWFRHVTARFDGKTHPQRAD